MSTWQVICLLVVIAVLQVNGNPVPEKTDRASSLKAMKRSLCNYFANPTLDNYALLSIPVSSSGYLINLRPLRNRCRYFKKPTQKHSVWDLTRK